MKKIQEKVVDLGLEVALTSTAYRIAGRKSLDELGLHNITRQQFGILLVLSFSDGLYQTQIANILGKDRPNITRMIDILETNGFIRREKDQNNRRILKVYLTESGKKEVEFAKPLIDKMNKVQYKGLSNDEILMLTTLLKKVRTNIETEYNING